MTREQDLEDTILGLLDDVRHGLRNFDTFEDLRSYLRELEDAIEVVVEKFPPRESND